MAAHSHLRLIHTLWLPKFLAHHILHKTLPHHHTNSHRCIFCQVFFYSSYTYFIYIISIGNSGKSMNYILSSFLYIRRTWFSITILIVIWILTQWNTAI